MQVRSTRDPALVGGIALVGLGAVLLLVTMTGAGGEIFLVAAGAVFLVAYAVNRRYGFLIPGFILVGLGAGVMVQTYSGLASAPVLGLGLGFLAIYAANILLGRAVQWWPLVPGGILAMAGIAQLGQELAALAWVAAWWPVVLILIGVLLLIRRRPTAS